MKRTLITFLIVGLFASVANVEATEPSRTERTVVGGYGPYPAPVTGCTEPLSSFACLVVQTGMTEAFFTARVTYSHGQPVYVEVLERNGTPVGYFCGATTSPIRFEPLVELHFNLGLNNTFPSDNWLLCPTNRVKTTGTIRVTLSNIP